MYKRVVFVSVLFLFASFLCGVAHADDRDGRSKFQSAADKIEAESKAQRDYFSKFDKSDFRKEIDKYRKEKMPSISKIITGPLKKINIDPNTMIQASNYLGLQNTMIVGTEGDDEIIIEEDGFQYRAYLNGQQLKNWNLCYEYIDTVNNNAKKTYCFLNIDAKGGNDKIYADVFFNDDTICHINGGAGNDDIMIHGGCSDGYISGDTGDDYFNTFFKGEHLTVDGGNGADNLYTTMAEFAIGGKDADEINDIFAEITICDQWDKTVLSGGIIVSNELGGCANECKCSSSFDYNYFK